jgi:DNA polymerase III subunit beta
MRAEVNFEELKRATLRLQGTVSDRSLSHVGISASNGQLLLTATDRVLSIYSKLPAKVIEEGVIFVPGKIFLDLSKELPTGTIRLIANNQQLEVEAESGTKFHMKIPLLNDLEWFNPPEFETPNQAIVETAALAYMINQVQFCISQESPRAFGTVGLLHKPENQRVRLVGTDGFRLSYCDIFLDAPESFLAEGICLSKRALNELLRLCQEGSEKILLRIDEGATTLEASTDECRIFVRLSAIRFPNYLGVLPTANLNLVKLSRAQVQNVMRRVMLAADKSRALQLSFSNSSLTLRSKTIGSSEGEESIDLDGYRGNQRDLSVNGRFLSDVFSAIAGDRITLQFKSSEDPIVIVPEEELPQCKSLHVLVPIRESV